MFWRVALSLALALAVGLVGLAFSKPAAALNLAPGFQDQVLAGVPAPTSISFTPDGRMLVSTQQGRLLVYRNDILVQDPAVNLAANMCSDGERGLLGTAVDPDFASNRYVYVYYTANKTGTCNASSVNRVSRFVLGDNNVISRSSEKVLVDGMPSPGCCHNAGDLHFGKDDNLYISVGDGGTDYAGNSGGGGVNDAARDPHVLLGKILRVTRDGAIPSDNPYAQTGDRCAATGFATAVGRQCQETFASGLRNPFRFAMDPNAPGTRFFINDVGQNAWEEIDEGKAGADYGWNHCEGTHDNPSRSGVISCGAPFTPPIYEYGRDTGCSSITGGAFVPNGVWPAGFDGKYLFSDFVCGKIFILGGGELANDLGGGSAVHMAFGPYRDTQALYYTSYAGGGQVHRIVYTGSANRTPTAAVTADPSSGPTPLQANFDGSGSRDPDGNPLTYVWDFKDGSTAETATPTTSHTYNTAGTFNVELRVRDNQGATSAPVTVRIDPGNAPPAPVIGSPTQAALFKVGEQITLSGSATDTEDGGPVPTSSLSWEVVRHHNDSHEHPFVKPTVGNDVTFTAPAPEDLFSTGPGNYLEVKLTATDSKGLKKTVTRYFLPNTVDLNFLTDPDGLQIEIDGNRVPTPRSLTSWEGYGLSISAPTQTAATGKAFGFSSWSDGGAATHRVTTPAANETYKATFRELPPPPYSPPPPYVYEPPPNYAAPTIDRQSPAAGSSTRDRTPTISARVRDSQTDLARGNVTLFVDGRRVRFSYSPASDRLKYTAGNPLRVGRHTVKVVANDGSISNSRTWRFRVAE